MVLFFVAGVEIWGVGRLRRLKKIGQSVGVVFYRHPNGMSLFPRIDRRKYAVE